MSAPVERALRDVTLFPLWLDNPAAPTPERPLSDPQAALGQGRYERPFMAEKRRSRTARVDPIRPFKVADANVGFRITNRPSIDGAANLPIMLYNYRSKTPRA